VHITGPSPTDPVDLDVGFFTDPGDVDIKQLVWAYKKQREIVRRTRFYRGELARAHPAFPAGSAAACVENVAVSKDDGSAGDGGSGGVGEKVVEDIVYSAEDDMAIEQWLRANLCTSWHNLGSAKMAPRDDGGVVDPALNVYGVTGLKVADLSICPANVAANTANTAFVIGEKAADLIIAELGLKPAAGGANV
jgi:choline dehydrogenase-like flavoprotein